MPLTRATSLSLWRPSALLHEFGFAMRALRRTPGSAAIAVFALGTGLGLSTAMFSILRGAMLTPPPFEQPRELVHIEGTNPRGGGNITPTVHEYAAWQASNRTFEEVGAYLTRDLNVNAGAGQVPERLRGAQVTSSTLRLLGIRPALGRLFDPRDDVVGAGPVILLGWTVWQDRFAGDPGVVGRTVRADGVQSVIVGVMPPNFGFPESEEVWLPLRIDAARAEPGSGPRVQVVGRLRDGVNLETAKADLTAISARLVETYPSVYNPRAVRVTVLGAMDADDRAMLFINLGAVLAVLCLACVNVAGLLVARASSRTKEIGLRLALGASRFRVAQQFLAESAVLAGAGGVLGVALAYAGLRFFVRSIAAYHPPSWMVFRIDAPALAFAGLVTIGAALLAGVLPAWQASRLLPQETLKDGSRGSTSFRIGRVTRGLVVAQIALTFSLLVAAGLMVRSVIELNTIDLGVQADNVLVARVGLPQAEYAGPDPRRQFAGELLPRLRAIPGVESAALSSDRPFQGTEVNSVAIEGVTAGGTDGGRDAIYAMVPAVSTGYFDALNRPHVRGRDFTSADVEGALPVAIVNLSFVHRYFPDGGALGHRVRIGREKNPWLTIVGVVPDLPESGLRNWWRLAVYRPLAQQPPSEMTLVLRTRLNPLDLTPQVRDQVRGIDPNLPLYEVNTLRSAILQANFLTGITGGLFGAFGLAALLIASVGLYGVMSFTVGQRRREIGVRLALGAKPGSVVLLVLRQGIRRVFIGLAIGAVLAFMLAQGIANSLFGVGPTDPLTVLATAALLVGVAGLACGIPAIRATRIGPARALLSD